MYRYKENSNIDAYNDTMSVIHFKFGDCRKHYFFTEEFVTAHPKFAAEYAKYFIKQKSLFSDPLSIVNYIEVFKLPVRLYSNYVDEEFEDINACKEWICQEYGGQNRDKLFTWGTSGYKGLDGEIHNFNEE